MGSVLLYLPNPACFRLCPSPAGRRYRCPLLRRGGTAIPQGLFGMAQPVRGHAVAFPSGCLRLQGLNDFGETAPLRSVIGIGAATS